MSLIGKMAISGLENRQLRPKEVQQLDSEGSKGVLEKACSQVMKIPSSRKRGAGAFAASQCGSRSNGYKWLIMDICCLWLRIG